MHLEGRRGAAGARKKEKLEEDVSKTTGKDIKWLKKLYYKLRELSRRQRVANFSFRKSYRNICEERKSKRGKDIFHHMLDVTLICIGPTGLVGR